jgi:hypothetical protein
MRLKKNLLIFTFLMCLNCSHSQHDLNHRRYWFYRTRFINDFVKIGPNQGDCICFPQRNYGGATSNVAKVGPDQMDQINMYLAALALEYQILKRNNQDTKETIKEMFYIIDTYNRLDEEADQFWSTTPPQYDYPLLPIGNDRNGFILREDMPQLYFDPSFNNSNYLHFNYAKKEYNNNFASSQWSYSGLPEITQLTLDNKFSDYAGFTANNHSANPNPKTGLSIPHDKYHSMFFAFLFIVKYLPNDLGYIDENNSIHAFTDGETSIKKEVIKITERCHPYLRGNLFGNPVTNWTTEYPDGSNTQNLGSPLPFSYPLVNMIAHIKTPFPIWTYPNLNEADVLAIANVNSYITLSSTIFLPSAINTVLNLIGSNTIGIEDAAVFLAYDQASCNTYPGPTPIWLKMQQNTAFFNLEWADLARKVLHQTGVFTKQNSVYETPLNQANCQGPWNFGNCNHAGCEWSATDRIEHPSRRNVGCTQFFNCNTQTNQTSFLFPGNYPGVDYMLLHNLYYEHLNQKYDQNPHNPNSSISYTAAYNFMDNEDDNTWPFKLGNFVLGVNSVPPYGQPQNIKVFQNLVSHAQIYATSSPQAINNTISSKIEYRAGKEITLLPEDLSKNLPGFEVKYGSDFHAYVKRYVCGQDDYTNGMRQANGEEAINDNYEADDMNSIPIHYIEYPELSDADKFPFGSMTDDPNFPIQNFEEVSEQQLIQKVNSDNNIITTYETAARFEVLPNPSTGLFKIITNKIDLNEVLSIVIIDMKGNIVYSNPDFKTTEIDLSQYSNGIYMLQMTSSLGKKYSKRLNLID